MESVPKETIPTEPEKPVELPDIITVDVKLYNEYSENFNPEDGMKYLNDIKFYLEKYAPDGMYLSKKATGEFPVFLLDDVLSELDSNRRSYILGCLSDRQIIVTSCENDHFKGDNVKFITASGGKIIEE